MAAQFRCDDKVTIEVQGAGQDATYGTPTGTWSTVAANIWASVQDVLPSRAEKTENDLRIGVQQTRLRIRKEIAATAQMRVTLHGQGGRVMQIVAGPARMANGTHNEFMLESYSS